MKRAYLGPDPDEGAGLATLVLTLVVIGVVMLVALEEPGMTVIVGIVGLFVIGSIGGES